ncbi:MAG: hypothetical protein ACLFWL_18810 [Candidatus Brocadiia bacterium]
MGIDTVRTDSVLETCGSSPDAGYESSSLGSTQALIFGRKVSANLLSKRAGQTEMHESDKRKGDLDLLQAVGMRGVPANPQEWKK